MKIISLVSICVLIYLQFSFCGTKESIIAYTASPARDILLPLA